MRWDDLEHCLRLHAARGGPQSRRRQVMRARQWLAWCRAHGVRQPDQIGRRHVWEWYRADGPLSAATMRDRYYAVRLVWRLLGRGERPPQPAALSPPRRAVERAGADGVGDG